MKQKKCYTNAGLIIQTRHFPLAPLTKDALNVIPCQENGYVLVENGRISAIGPMDQWTSRSDVKEDDLKGGWIFPAFVDSHTHTVFPYYRSDEFEKRLAGVSYQQIAIEGGGILNTARKLSEYSEEKLFEMAKDRVNQIIRKGTGALEIKSGYGLTTESELKMLRVIRRLKEHFPIPIKATFLGAHAIPADYKNRRSEYIDLLCGEMLELISQENLADYVDAFCETGYFTTEETSRIMKAASAKGLSSKIHTNQFTSIGGIQAAIEEKALSVDHLEVVTDKDIEDLAQSETIACLLPIAPFFLNDPYPPGRQMVDSGVRVALATDFNPGSAPSHDMALAISLACIKCGMRPNEAINAATINASFAMELQNIMGCMAPGLLAHFFITPALKSLADIPYRICSENISRVIIQGEDWQDR